MSNHPTMRAPKKVPGIENRQRSRDGATYWTFRVRWIDPPTGERRGEEFDTQGEAIDFKAKLRIARRSGRLDDIDAGRETLTAFVAEWWQTYAGVHLERNTLKVYKSAWDNHLLPRVGHLQLRQIDPLVVAKLRQELEGDGVGLSMVRTTMAVLQSVFSRAVEWGRVKTNPVAAVKKPTPKKTAVRPLPPLVVETILDELPTPRDRIFVAILAYAGLRPEEALALQWLHIRKTTILVEQKVVGGELFAGQKTSRPPRTVDLLKPLAADLAAYKLSLTGTLDSAFLFPAHDGQVWRDHTWRNWRKRTYRPAAEAAGVDQPGRPYVCRHSYASLRIHEGKLSVAELAEQMGHNVQTLLKVYTHVIAELKGQKKVPAATQIQQARAKRQKAAIASA